MVAILKLVSSAVLLLALLVGAKFLLEHNLAPRSSGIHGELEHRGVEIVLVGSSHTRQGYDAAAIERGTGRKAFVVAYDGLDLVSMLPLVRALLRDPPNLPKLLVVEAYSGNLARNPEIGDPRLFFDAPPRTKWELLQTYLRTHRGIDGWLDAWALLSNKGNELVLTYPLVYQTLESLSYNGGYVGKSVPGVSPPVFLSLRLPITRNHADSDQVAALNAIIAATRQAHVRMLLADPPLPAPVEAQPAVVELQREFRALAAANDAPFYEGAVDFPIRDPRLFFDSNHLSTAGRELYTMQFVNALKETYAALWE